MSKREHQREHIIKTAFKVWGASRFTDMSLTTLAEELALTKPALYRYFKNKDELMRAMRDRCAADYIRLSEQLIDTDSEQNLDELVHGFVELTNLFFTEQPEYAAFFVTQFIGPAGLTREDLRALFCTQHERLESAVRNQYPNAAPELLSTAGHFVMFSGVFWSMVGYIDQDLLPLDRHTREPAAIEASISRSYEVCMHGLLIQGSTRMPSFERVESLCRVGSDGRMEADRILSAIAEVVAEVGLFDATIERIAEKVGMSKSSLYFYFKNKDEMLAKMAQRLRMHFLDVLLARMEQFSAIEDRLYAFLIVTSAYMLQNPELLTIAHWFRAQNLDIELDSATRERALNAFTFLQAALRDGQIRARADELVAVVSYLHLYVMHDAAFFRPDISSEPELHRHMRSIYTLTMGGLRAAAVASDDAADQEGVII
ncbi:MAG: TetR/AcrR family transcriptional regulator [Spirochaetaceae bacterium]|nr:MAG: TetR/AcrR family transcriptional regulator [Spirochaetaceae bacterium]